MLHFWNETEDYWVPRSSLFTNWESSCFWVVCAWMKHLRHFAYAQIYGGFRGKVRLMYKTLLFVSINARFSMDMEESMQLTLRATTYQGLLRRMKTSQGRLIGQFLLHSCKLILPSQKPASWMLILLLVPLLWQPLLLEGSLAFCWREHLIIFFALKSFAALFSFCCFHYFWLGSGKMD